MNAICSQGLLFLSGHPCYWTKKKQMNKPNKKPKDIENVGRRVSRNDRRSYSYTVYIPERRSGDDRRSGVDRRKNK